VGSDDRALSQQDRPLAEDTEARMAEFTDLVGTAIANAQARADLMADESRRRIERNLHDGIQQRLVTLALQVRAIEENAPAEASEIAEQLAAFNTGLAEALDDLREVSRGVHPAILSEGGLVPALKSLGRRSALPMEYDMRVDTRLMPSVEVAAYYVVAEALANATKHANATVLRVSATIRDGRLLLNRKRQRHRGRRSFPRYRPDRTHRPRRGARRNAHR
jgi:signal transduction histidine kinase